ncbi:MAG: Copper P-type ATPase, partial [Parcubacteria group bacterium GW2011_GWC1_43_30]
VSGHTKDEVLELAASLDALSEHPIAKAVVAKAKERGLLLKSTAKFEALKGKGVKALVEDKEVMVGGPALLESMEINIPDELSKQVRDGGRKGQTIIFTLKEGILLGTIALADIIREESREAIEMLRVMGVRTAMITGDSLDVAKWVSEELKIDEYFARVLPHEKSDKIKAETIQEIL